VPAEWNNGLCACTPWAVEAATATGCVNTNEHGSCAGSQWCTDDGLSACAGPTAAAEVCNGADDDCDGQADEGCPPPPMGCAALDGPCPVAPPECKQTGGVGGPGAGLTPAEAGGFGLEDQDTWAKGAAFLDALAAQPGATQVTLEALLNDLNRQAVQVSAVPNVGCAHTGFEWNSGDDGVDYWMPQGITGTAAADASGLVAGKSVVAVSWWHKHAEDSSIDSTKGVRISFADVTEMSDVDYRHVLLVQPIFGSSPPDYEIVPVHAGGIAWYGDYLYVADTTKGFRVFDIKRPIQVSTGEKGLVGHVGDGVYRAHGYKYVLVQINRYKLCGASCCARFSFAAVDRSASPHGIVAGEYSKSSGMGRLHRWPLDETTGRLPAPSGMAAADAVWHTGKNRMQGGVTYDGVAYVSSSSQIGKYGALYRSTESGWSAHKWVHGAEDLHVAPGSGDVWSLSEFPGSRWVFATKLSALAAGCQ